MLFSIYYMKTFKSLWRVCVIDLLYLVVGSYLFIIFYACSVPFVGGEGATKIIVINFIYILRCCFYWNKSVCFVFVKCIVYVYIVYMYWLIVLFLCYYWCNKNCCINANRYLIEVKIFYCVQSVWCFIFNGCNSEQD